MQSFAYRINPAFHRFPSEAIIIGRLVVAFGELEYMTVDRAARAITPFASGDLDKYHSIIKALYRLRSTSSRLNAADAIMRPFYHLAELENEYCHMFSALRYCLRIRNQFAHCNWADDANEGLFFTDLQESADSIQAFVHHWYHVDVNILDSQE